jgi:predicted transcriptional regulator of viral defense system
MMSARHKNAIAVIKRMGVFRPRDVATRGISRPCLGQLCSQGLLVRLGRGAYIAADKLDTASEKHDYACAAALAPDGVVCLLSALMFHNVTTQLPREVWLAIARGKWRPCASPVPLRVMWYGAAALRAGVEEHLVGGVRVKVFSPAKTVVDCFKYRNKVGLDVALEALRECYRTRRVTADELWKYASICRVANVMRPYLESLV